MVKIDRSVLSFKIEGPDGDKLTEHLRAQRSGVDPWAPAAPRSVAYYDRDGAGPDGWVHIDAANRHIESPAEQGVSPGYQRGVRQAARAGAPDRAQRWLVSRYMVQAAAEIAAGRR